MKKIRIGVNGIGRIGRAVSRIAMESDDIEVVAFNDINPDIRNIAYLLEYDSTYGRLKKNVLVEGNKIIINGKPIAVHHEKDITKVPWEDCDVDIVVESSGAKSNLNAILEDEKRGSKRRYVITHAPNVDLKTIIFGVNEHEFDPAKHRVVSSSICDTVALSPILKILQQTHQIESGFLTTLHPWLSYQNLVDGPSVSWSQPGDIFSHYALGRASTQNLIPKSTSAVLAADFVFPGLSERLQSFSYRVPTPIVTSSTLIVYLDKPLEKEFLMQRFEEAEKGQKTKVIKNSVLPLTSLDYAGDEHSVIIDHRWTKIERDRHLKLVYWYDNEWGYSSRVVDLVSLIGTQSGVR